jgi:hypothetical protein
VTIDELAYAEEKQLGGWFDPGLNGLGENVVPECAGGFSTVAVAKTGFFTAAISMSSVCRKENSCSNVAFVPGCASRGT